MDDRFRFLFHPDDPFRHPARRWFRACHLHRHGLRLRADDDAVVREGVRFLRTREQWRTEAARLGIARQSLVPNVYMILNEPAPGGSNRQKIIRSYNAVVEAHRVYATGKPLERGELQGRLLAGESDASIAVKCGLSEAAVATFGGLFYDVRPWLRADSYIVGVVLRAKPHRGFDRDDHCGLLSFIGYGLGSAGIDAVLDYFREPPVVPASLDSLTLSELEKQRRKVMMKLLVLVLTIPLDKMGSGTLLKAHERLAPGASDNGTLGPLRATLDAMGLFQTRPLPDAEIEPVPDQVVLPSRTMLFQHVADLWQRRLVAA